MRIYATSVVIVQNDEITHELFTFSLQPGAESTPDQMAAELAKPFLPKDGEFTCQVKTVSVDFHKHFERYIDTEFQEESKEA